MLDEILDADDLPETDKQSEQSEDEAPDMLLNFNNLVAQGSDFDSHSESDYSTSESEDSGIEY